MIRDSQKDTAALGALARPLSLYGWCWRRWSTCLWSFGGFGRKLGLFGDFGPGWSARCIFSVEVRNQQTKKLSGFARRNWDNWTPKNNFTPCFVAREKPSAEILLSAKMERVADFQKELDEQKRKMRFENEQYLRDKPELTMLMRVILSELLDQTPPDPVKFVAEFCSKPNLRERVLAAAQY